MARVRGRRRIGLLGGSFNPAHDGHLYITEKALDLIGLDEVWWLVSPQNPLKPSGDMAPFAERLAVARRLARDRRIVVTDLEVQLGSVFTVDTLSRLKRLSPRTCFVWMMGADNLRQISAWRRWTRIFELMPIVVFNRRGYAYRALASRAARRYGRHRVQPRRARRLPVMKAPAWLYLHIRPHPASASAIRTTARSRPRVKIH